MPKTSPITYRHGYAMCHDMPGMEDYAQQVRDNTIGCEPPGGPTNRARPEATRTTARPWGETDNRKPYMPTEDVSEPSLEDGVSFRQSF